MLVYLTGPKAVRVALVFGLFLALLNLVSCTRPDSALSIGSAPPGTKGNWISDGNIGSQEYTSKASYGDFEIFWSNDAQNVYVGMRARTSGWVSMAVQPNNTRMNNADMVFGYVKDGTVTALDLFSLGEMGPHPPDTEQGGKDDILAFGGSERDGYTTIEFVRALDTGDSYDRQLVMGKNQIIWAYGPTDEFKMKHSFRGWGEIELH